MTFRDIFTNYATSLRNRSYELCMELVPICRDITKSNPKKPFASYIAFLLYTLPLKSLTTEVIDEILLSKRQYAEALHTHSQHYYIMRCIICVDLVR